MVKRAAEKQLTKDDQQHEDDEQESNHSLNNENSFIRASEEEISRRRVIKARRLRPILSSENSNVSMASMEANENSLDDSMPQTSSNPFASVSLVPTSSVPPKEEQENLSDEVNNQVTKSSDTCEQDIPQSSNRTDKDNTKPVEEETDKTCEIGAISTKKENSTSKEADTTKLREDKTQPNIPRSFGGFSGGEVHMDQLARQSKGLQSSTGSNGLVWNDLKSTKPSSSSENPQGEEKEESEDNVDNTEQPESYDVPIEAKEPILPEQKTVTGEENEENLVRIRGKLYALEDKQWKEKGSGQLRFNVQKEAKSRGRFVMRAEGNLRVLLNFPLYPEFRIDRASEKSLRFCAPGEDLKPQSFLFRTLSKEDASKLETTCVEWLKNIQ